MRIVTKNEWTMLRLLGALSLLLAVSAMTSAPVNAQGNDCAVSEGVVQNGNTITGTSGNDTIDCTGSTSGKIITGGDGNDTITGGLGADYIDGGPGNDTITGGPANDCLWGQGGDDTLTGSEGMNTIYAGAGENTVSNNDDPEGVVTGCNEDGTVGAPSTVEPGVTVVPSTVEPGVMVVPSTVEPGVTVTLVAVTISSPSVTGGDSTTSTVTLSAPAPAGGAIVLLTSDSPTAGVAASVFVLEGDTTAVFEIGTASVTETSYATISASWNGTYASAVLEIRPGSSSVATDQSETATEAAMGQPGSDTNTGSGAGVTSLPSTGNGSGSGQGPSSTMLMVGAITLAAFIVHQVWNQRRVR